MSRQTSKAKGAQRPASDKTKTVTYEIVPALKVEEEKHNRQSSERPKLWPRVSLTMLIAMGGLFISIINTYWIHFRKDERLTVTIMDFGFCDPTPTSSFFTVDAVFANKGNLPAVITSCTLSLSDKQDMSSRIYLVWSEPEALMMPPQDLKVRQLKYGEQVFSLGIKEWGTNVAVNARLDLVVVDYLGQPHKVLIPMKTITWQNGISIAGGKLSPQQFTLLPSPIFSDNWPISP